MNDVQKKKINTPFGEIEAEKESKENFFGELSKIEDSRIKNAERTLHARMTPFEREEAARWTGMYRFLLDEDDY